MEIQSPKREPGHPVKEVTGSTDFHCQRTNLVQLSLGLTLINNYLVYLYILWCYANTHIDLSIYLLNFL